MLLAQRIRQRGPIPVACFMREALSHPELGYYATRDPLGVRGDFITAPEVSQIFGELIGLWCVDLWERMGAPERVVLAELGPGRGTLMADALRAAKVRAAFARAAELHLVETSPVLRETQSRALTEVRPVWHDDAADLPAGPLLLVANEFLDALPIRQFERLADGWHERLVGLAGEEAGFAFAIAPDPTDEAWLPPTASVGAIAERSPDAVELAEHLGARLRQSPGAALFLDYGYGRGASGDSLQAVRAHRPQPVLADPGTADLTAHVDFAAIARAAEAQGARVLGPVTQASFLRSLGIGARADRLSAGASPAQAGAIDAACHRLVDPAGMGTLFKALVIVHPAGPIPAGFAAEGAA